MKIKFRKNVNDVAKDEEIDEEMEELINRADGICREYQKSVKEKKAMIRKALIKAIKTRDKQLLIEVCKVVLHEHRMKSLKTFGCGIL
mgnify:FL=1